MTSTQNTTPTLKQLFPHLHEGPKDEIYSISYPKTQNTVLPSAYNNNYNNYLELILIQYFRHYQIQLYIYII